MSRVAVIGGGLCGLTAAIRLSQQGVDVELWEAANHPGGRTSSYFDQEMQTWVDRGPHLMVGAYQATRALLGDAGAEPNVHFQPSLSLPLWDGDRGYFSLEPSTFLPLALALPLSLGRLPGHGLASLMGMLRLGAGLKRGMDENISIEAWLAPLNIPERLRRDLLEVLCLGAMNEAMGTASAASFARVLHDSFISHDAARLGWFRAPLRQALIDPLINLAHSLGAHIRLSSPVRRLSLAADKVAIIDSSGQEHGYDQIILALPPWQGNRLLKTDQTYETPPIINAHFWFDSEIQLPTPIIGTLGTHAHWWFDIDAMHGRSQQDTRHLCAVISADDSGLSPPQRTKLLRLELSDLLGLKNVPKPAYQRHIIERRATSLVRSSNLERNALPRQFIDAGEIPQPGQLPATIEAAVRRGEKAAKSALEGEHEIDYPL
ncbi:MAG: FAD-dependent oxidoreductase [Mariprofundaceae bacterium]